MNRKWFGTIGILVFMILALSANVIGAGVPGVIDYQGRLTNVAGAPVADNNYLIKFKIYGSLAGADSLWSSGFLTVAVAGGLFSCQLSATGDLFNDIFRADTIRYLGITVGVDPEISPRSRLISTPYSFKSIRSDTANVALVANDVATGIITNSDINSSAAIAASKISGTAATLSGTQTFTATNTFNASLKVGDSTFTANANGVRIGDSESPYVGELLAVERVVNSTNNRYGINIDMTNTGTGATYGLRSTVIKNAGLSGSAYGISSACQADGAYRYGITCSVEAASTTLTTGNSYGIYASARDGSYAYGVYGYAADATNNYAGFFMGDAVVNGTLYKSGGSFKIDHPLDPENKYLQHSFVESPDMMNIYNGNITLNEQGEAWVELPEWFGALNKDFRYQLTAIGAPGPNLYIAQKVIENKFMIAGGTKEMEVSWQVTGIRKDKWAEANRIQVEVDKRPEERGKYLHPEVFNLPMERSIEYENLKPVLEARERDLSDDNADKEE
jgi:hypothetical protein